MLVIISAINLMGQDNESPLSPQLTLVTVDPDNGFLTSSGHPVVHPMWRICIYTYS